MRDGDGRLRLFGVEGAARVHLLGTDGFGRDPFSRLLHGGRVSLFAGLLAGVLSATAGLALGLLAGYFRGWVDELLKRASELFMALPWLYLLLAARAFLPLQLTSIQALHAGGGGDRHDRLADADTRRMLTGSSSTTRILIPAPGFSSRSPSDRSAR